LGHAGEGVEISISASRNAPIPAALQLGHAGEGVEIMIVIGNESGVN